MNIPLLKTKLYIPPARQDLVLRPHLVARLEEGVRQSLKLTLVCAPAGFGKTTLLSEWVAVRGTQMFAWVSLDEGDNDASRFWAYVISALQTLYPDLGLASMGVLQSAQGQAASLEPLLISLVNEISSLVEGKDPIILVLDDYHTITTRSIHKDLDYLLDHLPPNLRLVLASREDPPLALSLLRGRGQLCEIRSADLRFSTGETGDFLKAVIGQDLSTNDIAALDNRTEGWVAGLQMAALSLKGQTDPEVHDFISTFAGDDRYISDYLVDQVLHRQIPYIQRFLIQTSILDRLCGSLCDAVLANLPKHQEMSSDSLYEDSQQVLEYLDRTGLFVIPLDNRRQWYRYHHLFADLLRSRLQTVSESLFAAEEEKPEIATLHLRASTWFEGEGLVAEAMDHALAACDYERAADLIERYFKETIWFGEFGLISKWLDALPKALIRTRPFLCLLYGALSLSHSTEAAEEWLQAGEKAWNNLSQRKEVSSKPLSTFDYTVFSANVADIRVQIADMNGVPNEGLIALTLQALEKTPKTAPSLRASMLQKLGWYHLNLGDEAAAEDYFAQSKELGEISGHFGNILNSTIGQAIIAWRHGELCEAVTICHETLHTFVDPMERSGRRMPIAGNLYIILGQLLFELFELEEAEANLVKGVELVELTTPIQSSDLLDGYHALACLRCIEGDFEGAFAWMERAERTCTWAREGVRTLWVRIWLWRAQVEADRHYLDQALAWADECNLQDHAGDECDLQSLAQVIIAGYRADGEPDLEPLLSVLDEQLSQAEAAGRDDQAIYMLTLEALARQAMGQVDAAMDALERVLPIAAAHEFVMTFIRHGTPMEELLREATARGICGGYVDRLLTAFRKGSSLQPPADAHPAQAVPPEPLSKRELDVLRLLTSSLTGPQIADELFISLGTFQTHTKRIYSKLGVHNRLEAIERARELKLF